MAQWRQLLHSLFLLQMVDLYGSSCLQIQRLFTLDKTKLSLNITNEFLLLLLKILPPMLQLIQVGSFFDPEISGVAFGSA